MTEAIGYVRVSTLEQADSGLGLEAQRVAIAAACRARGLELVRVYADAGVSSMAAALPELEAALLDVESERGRVLVVSHLDRLSRSLTRYAVMVDRSRRKGWQLLALDSPDGITPQGEAMQAMVAVFAQLERRLISQRTREALAAARARGVTLGRPVLVDDQVAAEIVQLHRRRRLSARAIARGLNADGEPGPGGGLWHPSTVARVLARAGVTLKRGRNPNPRLKRRRLQPRSP